MAKRRRSKSEETLLFLIPLLVAAGSLLLAIALAAIMATLVVGVPLPPLDRPTATSGVTPSPTLTMPAATPTPIPTPAATTTPTPTPAATATPTPTSTPTATPTPAPTPIVLADLVVTDMKRTPDPIVLNQDGNIEVAIVVAVENTGKADAAPFKIVIRYTDAAIRFTDLSRGSFVAPFAAEGQESPYPFTDAPLAPGDGVLFTGVLAFPADIFGSEVLIWAEADSCFGEEFVPEFCRVDESDELNNLSSSISVLLAIPGPD